MSENNTDMKILPVLLTAACACKDCAVQVYVHQWCDSLLLAHSCSCSTPQTLQAISTYCRVTSSQYIQSNCFYNLAPSNISVLNSVRLIIIIILLPFVLLSKSIHGPLAREYWILDRCFLEDCNSQLLVSECILAFVNFPIPHQTFCCSPPPLRPAPPFQDLELNTFCLTQSSAS